MTLKFKQENDIIAFKEKPFFLLRRPFTFSRRYLVDIFKTVNIHYRLSYNSYL